MSVQPITKPYRVASGEGLANFWWKTGRMTVKASGAETGNAFSQVEVDGPRGDAPPRHLHHNEDETFYVFEGELTVLVGDERIDLKPGDYCFAPRGILHTHIVTSERARFLTTLSPAGLEQLFVELGTPVTGAEPPTDIVLPPMDETVRVFGSYGVDLVGPPLTLEEVQA
jgi:quercetin dioxygenase-like cupin family protein